MANEEQVFLNAQGALVSTNRVVLGGTTYATRNISSVRVGAVSAKVMWPILALCVGLIWTATAASNLDWKGTAYGMVPLLIGAAILFTRKTTWVVYLTTNSGEVKGSASVNRTQIDAIANAIITAISQR